MATWHSFQPGKCQRRGEMPYESIYYNEATGQQPSTLWFTPPWPMAPPPPPKVFMTRAQDGFVNGILL